jgi:hypothetical protein
LAFRRTKPPPTTGEAELRIRGRSTAVTYEIDGDPNKLRAGGPSLRGALCATPEIAHEAFGVGEAVLTFGGSAFRLSIIAHTAGSNVAYFDMRV